MVKNIRIKILRQLKKAEAAVEVSELVRLCFGKVSRSDNRPRYQSAYARMSRALRLLEKQGLVECEWFTEGGHHSPDWEPGIGNLCGPIRTGRRVSLLNPSHRETHLTKAG